MTDAVLEVDAPACADCGYSLVGLDSDRCPECGVALGPDRSAYRPSRSRTPWSAVRPRWLVAGVPLVLVRPLRSLDACASSQRVTAGRAAAFGALSVALLVLCWPLVRGFIEAMLRAVERGTTPWLQLRGFYRYGLFEFRTTWWRLWVWEAWSVTKWLWLFTALAVFLPAGRQSSEPGTPSLRSARDERLCRLMLFAPWLLVLEVGLYLGVSITDFGTVAEPSTTFGHWGATIRYGTYATPRFWTFWLARTVPPVGVVGFVFFRGVLRWRPLPAVVGAAALVLPAIALQITWSDLWIRWNLRRF